MNTLLKRCCSILLIFTLVFTFMAAPTVQVKAAINSDYGNNHTSTEIGDLKEKDDDAGLIGLLARAILFLAKKLEDLVSLIIGLLSGDIKGKSAFPWADQIVFNAIPILDCNFINPDSGSLFSIGSGVGQIGNVVRNVYFTGVSLAIGFLGIVVAIMSIRMAISTIAAVKAQYKESIVNLMTTLVLIFGLHFLLSGMFYINEKMVEVASTIVRTITNPNGVENPDSPTSISSMGKYFYDTAIDEGGTHKVLGLFEMKAVAPVPTVLYCIFIYQSLVFLVAYFKRFFYVVILSVIGPFVVMYDFLKKVIG